MNQMEFQAQFQAYLDKMKATMLVKNADYAGALHTDPFANFTMVEKAGICATEQGFLTRMSDKFCRVATFVKKGILQVKDESVEDTLLDLANYALLLACYVKGKRDEEQPDTGGAEEAPQAKKRGSR